MKKLSVLLGILVIALSACMPRLGETADNPYDGDNDVQVKPGLNYVSTSISPRAFGIEDNEYDNLVPIDFNNQNLPGTKKEFGADGFTGNTVRVPDGWKANFARAKYGRYFVNRGQAGATTTVTYRNYVSLVFGINIPPGTRPGPYAMSFQVSRGTKTANVTLEVEVIQ